MLKTYKAEDVGGSNRSGPMSGFGFGDDAAMDQNLGQGSGGTGSAGVNAANQDPLLDNAYTNSLLPGSRHPLFALSPKVPQLYF